VINLNSRKKQKIVRVFFLLVLFFVGNYYLGNLINNKVNHEIDSYTLTNLDILRTSGYWNLPPFVIDDSATGVGAQNWTWAETQPWCSGSGTFEDPYLIENVTIDGGWVNCITIKYSDKYFRIENCTVINSGGDLWDGGILLDYVGNGALINNNVSFNESGLLGMNGIFLSNSDNNTVSGNTANNNGYYGIYLYNSDNNTVSGNTANNNSMDGIYLNYSDNNTVSGNTANNTYYHNGISLKYSDNNTISGNTANNNDDSGICLSNSDNNTVSGNTANNNNYGIYLHWSDITTVSGNYFNDNYRNAYTIQNTQKDNKWDNGIIGNYWDDYGGVDANDDGIGDTPYIILGTYLNQDNFPIWEDGDDIPLITINSPYSDQVFASLSPNYSVFIFAADKDSTWYTIDNGITNITFIGSLGGIDQMEWNKLGSGTVIIRFYANDTAGNIGSAAVTVKKDVSAPVITIILPLPNSVFDLVAPNYNISIDELNLDTIWYTLDGGITNYTITDLTGTFNHLAWEALSEGSLTIRFYAKDTAGNIGFIDVEVIIEIPEDLDGPPIISFGNYYILFAFVTILSFIILEKRKKN